jgi:hypothetical protein
MTLRGGLVGGDEAVEVGEFGDGFVQALRPVVVVAAGGDGGLDRRWCGGAPEDGLPGVPVALAAVPPGRDALELLGEGVAGDAAPVAAFPLVAAGMAGAVGCPAVGAPQLLKDQ